MITMICACGASLATVAATRTTQPLLAAVILPHVLVCVDARAGVMTLRCDACGVLRRFGPGVTGGADETVQAGYTDRRWIQQHAACRPRG